MEELWGKYGGSMKELWVGVVSLIVVQKRDLFRPIGHSSEEEKTPSAYGHSPKPACCRQGGD